MYWCNNCKAFHRDDMLKTIEESHSEQFTICGHCGSEDIESADECYCGEPKKEVDDRCEWCEATLSGLISVMISDWIEVTGQSRDTAINEIVDRLEDEI
jgi:hypothetical protein